MNMFIKVEIEENSPVFYRFTQHELTLGSSVNNSIVINHKSVSKKHLKLIFDEGKWFAVDQGSTNGSYVDQEQLIPGKRTEVDKDVTLRLGAFTTISFVESAEESIDVNNVEASSVATSISSESDRTRVINLADLQAAKVNADKKKKQELLLKHAKELKLKKEERKKLFKHVLLGLLILAAGFGANKWWQAKMKQQSKNTIISKMQNKFADDMEIDSDLEGLRISRRKTLAVKDLEKHLSGVLCRQTDITDLCHIKDVFGAKLLKPSTYLIFLDEFKFRVDAKILLPEGASEDEIRKTIALKFVINNFNGSTFPTHSVLYVVMFDDSSKDVTGVMALKTNNISMIHSDAKTEEKIVENAKRLESYYTYYPEKIQPRSLLQAIEQKSDSQIETIDP